jgi:hypothetical protein
MKRTQLFLLWLFYFASFCAQNTSQGAAITTKVDRRTARAARGANNGLYSLAP